MDDPLEQFRKNFFGILEKERLEKEKALKAKQRTCWHNFVLMNFQSTTILIVCYMLIHLH